jgi:hypothetical protein
MTLTLFLAIAAIVVGPFSSVLLAIYFSRQKNLKELEKAVADLVSKDHTRSPYFDELQRSLATIKHHPGPEHAEMDKLLEQLQGLTITSIGRARLEEILQAEIDDPEVPIALALKIISPQEKVRIQAVVDDARLLLATMPKVVAAQKAVDVIAAKDAKKELERDEPNRLEEK